MFIMALPLPRLLAASGDEPGLIAHRLAAQTNKTASE